MKRCCWIICLLLASCATEYRAPVIERAPATRKAMPPAPAKKAPAQAEKDWRPDTYTVKKGDTLYSIGLEFGFDHKEIAAWNNIPPPYTIYVGQQLKLKEPAAVSSQAAAPASEAVVVTPLNSAAAPAAKSIDEPPLLTEPKALKEPYSVQAMAEPPAPPASAKPAATAPSPAAPAEKPAAAADDESLEWAWPVNGKLLAGFNDASSAKGVDIGGAMGQPVYAAASGKVVYSGTGLRGYGKLIIIKHNKTYLSAYAHNSQLLVKEGQVVSKGQKIAEMGNSDTDQVKLHFEIRKLGKPVDPTKYLPANPG